GLERLPQGIVGITDRFCPGRRLPCLPAAECREDALDLGTDFVRRALPEPGIADFVIQAEGSGPLQLIDARQDLARPGAVRGCLGEAETGCRLVVLTLRLLANLPALGGCLARGLQE